MSTPWRPSPRSWRSIASWPRTGQTVPPHLASSLYNQSSRLAELGRQEHALAPITEAVAIYRELAADRPDEFRPYVAASLTSMGTLLNRLGDFDAALSADREATTIYAALNSLNPGQYGDSLQGAIDNLRIDLSALDRSEEEIPIELDRLLSTDD